MKKSYFPAGLLAVMILTGGLFLTIEGMAGQVGSQSQAIFKVPFEFRAADTKIRAGEYWFGFNKEGKLILRQISSGKELEIPILERLSPPEPLPAEPRLVFDEVGDFAPSYTEYYTVYVLSEIWLSAKDGYLIHTTKGTHKERIITGISADK
ncbi:MAG: hypothetical protein PHQ25_08625 [Acidobacteriota bacterium]|nr:hypothetical protein [Acidobacteriota bacterium]